ncbi:DUF6221 family protein [Actinocorallia longicatena]|uniref:YwqJ-like deaminase n=1 Tax=Actinocorallia longicatena TaxID=111803 RepID=A0ABP6Q5Y0_9ACTN
MREISPDEIGDPAEWARQWILADREAAHVAGIVAPGAWVHSHRGAPGVIYGGGDGRELAAAGESLRAVTEHLVRHDPEDVLSRCAAELAVLEAHGSNGAVPPSCRECRDAPHPCRTVLLLVSGYRHRPGYREGWRP